MASSSSSSAFSSSACFASRMGVPHRVLLFLVVCMVLVFSGQGAVGNGYKVSSVSNGDDGCIEAILDVISGTDTFGPDIQQLKVTARYETDTRIHVHITDNHSTRWEIPDYVISRNSSSQSASALAYPDLFSARFRVTDMDNSLTFSYTSQPFGFAITRNSTGEVLFNSTPSSASFGPLVFKDQYLEIATSLPKNASIYGLGESTKSDGLRLVSGHTYTLWASDQPCTVTNTNLYGSFPFYLDVRSGGNSHGVLLLNSNGMDVLYGDDFLIYKAIGGVMDFYFFAGPSPLHVVQQLTEVIGKPAAMPYWSFGFHQSRYGYRSVGELEDVVAKYAAANIPLEVMWSDIDHMDGRKDFTFDETNYKSSNMSNFAENLHAAGQYYILIIDPGIKVDQNYSTFINAVKADIFVKIASGWPYLGQVWPGPVNFPDFFHPNAQAFWTSEISDFHQRAQFDGLWIDMNEASNFCSGVTCSFPSSGSVCPRPGALTTCCLDCSNNLGSRWDYPPYRINNEANHVDIGSRTIATSAIHHNGILHYNAHNLYGLTEAMATNRALETVRKKRAFVLSRSTFLGSGKYAAHWTGDNAAKWEDLQYSIPGVLNAGLAGIPMAGVDICGFLFNTTEELCNRWIQVGAFYPFTRDHSDSAAMPQELYLWKSVAQSAQKALGLRYRLLPYLYTLAFEAHTMGSPIARPLFFSFPGDEQTLGINNQFLLGDAILVSPVLVSSATTINAYFPEGVWYNLFNLSDLIDAKQGSFHEIPAPWDTINVHVHEGSIIPMQGLALTTAQARKTPFTLVVAFSLESTSVANGHLFLDDGDSVDMEVANGSSTFVTYSATKDTNTGNLTTNTQFGSFALGQGQYLENVILLGLQKVPTTVSINNNPSSAKINQFATYGVNISSLHIPMGTDLVLSWSTSNNALF